MGADSRVEHLTPDKIYTFLHGYVQQGGEKRAAENDQYLRDHALRFLQTLKLLPSTAPGKKLLELGAAPYFMTLLVDDLTNYQVHIANSYKTGDPEERSIRIHNVETLKEHTYTYKTFNIELDEFPYPNNSFDFVLCCEMLEHLSLDPTHTLNEIHRVLEPGGRVMITTPNVLVLRNLINLVVRKQNIYFPYSGYGIYGRHNREWTLEELVQLVRGCGFTIEEARIVDTYPHGGYSSLLKRFFPSLRDMLVVIGRADQEAKAFYPKNFYRDFPVIYDASNPIASRIHDQKYERR